MCTHRLIFPVNTDLTPLRFRVEIEMIVDVIVLASSSYGDVATSGVKILTLSNKRT